MDVNLLHLLSVTVLLCASSLASALPSSPMMDQLAALHRSARSLPEHRRYMTLPTYFNEQCTAANCSAAQVTPSSSPTAPPCKLAKRRVVQLKTSNHALEIENSPLLYPDEKSYYHTWATKFIDGYDITSEVDQFYVDDFRKTYYDPTRYPPIYNKWECGPHECRLDSSTNTSAAVPTFGTCRHMCNILLVLRLVEKTPTCSVPNAGVVSDGEYVWAWCTESSPVALYCAPQTVVDDQDHACTGQAGVENSCHYFQHFAAE